MVPVEVARAVQPAEGSQPLRKRFKTSDLPLNSAQRNSIDALVSTIKKKGEFDAVRKQVWMQYFEGVSEHQQQLS